MEIQNINDSNIENCKVFFRRMRNEIVGSVENKLEYIKNDYFSRLVYLK